MLLIAGLSLKNLKPRVWDPTSPHWLRELKAVMVSYGEFDGFPAYRKQAMKKGLHAHLGVPRNVRIYLDNGAFSFLRNGGECPAAAYKEFVRKARPDWYPIPQEYIPTPSMSVRKQADCCRRTMAVNAAYERDGYVPVLHVGRSLEDYISAIQSNPRLAAKYAVALGAIVPNLLRAPKAVPYKDVMASLWRARRAFKGKNLHVFGMGGTATVHLAALMGFDSVDSSGWRNRAARGIIQLPGSGDRMIADLGNWRGRKLNNGERKVLLQCSCPACRQSGLAGLKASGVDGFCSRATHNLWVLLKEAAWVKARLRSGTYRRCYRQRLDNTTYLPLIEAALEERLRAGVSH